MPRGVRVRIPPWALMTYVQVTTKDGTLYDLAIWEVNAKDGYIILTGEDKVKILFKDIDHINNYNITKMIEAENEQNKSQKS